MKSCVKVLILMTVCLFLGSNSLFAVDGVWFYQHADGKGKRFFVKVGDNLPDLTKFSADGIGNWNDTISSIKFVGSDTVAVLYRDINFEGAKFARHYAHKTKVFLFNLSNLSDGLPSGKNWNDRASSIKVQSGF